MSKITVAGHSAHAIINDWPIALFSTSLVFDIIAKMTGRLKFAQAAELTQLGALGTGTVAALTGAAEYHDLRKNGRVREYANIHASLNSVAFGLSLGSYILRRKDPEANSNLFLALAGIATGITFISAWYGDEMVYGEGVRVRGRRMNKSATEIKMPGDEKLAEALRNPLGRKPSTDNTYANQSGISEQESP